MTAPAVPMLQALDIVRNIVDNRVIARAVENARDAIREGQSAAGAIHGGHGHDFFVGLDNTLANGGLVFVQAHGAGEAFLEFARHDFDGPLAGDLAGRLAARLARWGVGRGDRVGLFLPKGIEAVAAIPRGRAGSAAPRPHAPTSTHRSPSMTDPSFAMRANA